MSGMSEQALVAEAQQRLAAKYVQVPPDQIAETVRAAHASFIDCPIREFVPLLVERRAAAALARASNWAVAPV
ncbi:hypothetical protein HNP40_003344 [Mycobacteroides chelonae]|nr:hypothetical protein [Mycobacteroides chelonae]